MTSASARRKPRSPRAARSPASLLPACAIATAIVLAVAVAAWPRNHGPNGPVAGQAAATNPANPAGGIAPAASPTPTPPPSRVAHRVDLDLGPIVIYTPTQVPLVPTPTATPTRTPRQPPSGKDELMADGGFEAADGAWYLEPGAQIVTGDAHGGSALLECAPPGGYADQRVAVAAGTTYRLTLWVRVVVGGDAGQIGVRFEDAAHNRLSPDTQITQNVANLGWSEVTITFTAPEGAKQAIVSVWYPGGSGGLAIDDVSLRALI